MMQPCLTHLHLISLIAALRSQHSSVLIAAGTADEPASHQLDEDVIAVPAIELALKKMKAGGKSDLKIAERWGSKAVMLTTTHETNILLSDEKGQTWGQER